MTTLTLVVEKGPKKFIGSTVHRRATEGDLRIGRILKGNDFTIKDPSISQNHLTIHFDSTKWLVTDLQSSNGSFLNDCFVEPFVPTPLTHGDVIKIGSTTCIAVSVNNTLPPLPPPPPQSPKKEMQLTETNATRRRGNVLPLPNLDHESVKVRGCGPSRRGNEKKAPAIASEPEIFGWEQKIVVSESEVVGLEKKKAGGNRRRGKVNKKPIKRERGEIKVEVEHPVDPGFEQTGELGTEPPIGVSYREIEKTCKPVMKEIGVGDREIEKTDEPEVKDFGVSDQETKKAGKPKTEDMEVSDREIDEVGEDRGIEKTGEPGTENVSVGYQEIEKSWEPLLEEIIGVSEREIEKAEEQEKEDIEVSEIEKTGDPVTEDVGVADQNTEKTNIPKTVEEIRVVDPEKRTVADWIHDLEKYLPMMINDVAEECIAEIDENSRRLKAHIAQMFIRNTTPKI